MARIFRSALLFFVLLASGCGGGGGGGGGASGNASGNTGGTPAAPPLINDFAPATGSAGDTVRIQGINFGATVGGNSVHFNGTTATVLSATTREIVAAVPDGASSGPITVTTAAGSSTTSASFTVQDAGTPGQAWTTRMSGPGTDLGGIAWDGSRFVVAGDGIATSSDIVSWNEQRTFASLNDIQWNGQRFVGVGTFGKILTSVDGLTWTSIYTAANLYSVTFSDSTWVAVGDTGIIQTSADGLEWSSPASPVSSDFTTLYDVAWSGSQFVAVGNNGIIITSPDGYDWSVQNSGTSDSFRSVAATDSLIVASTYPDFGPTSAMYISGDGVNWTQQATGIGTYDDIIYAGDQWVAVGAYRVAVSADGMNWDVSDNAPGNNIGFLDAVTYDGTQYVAVDYSSVYSSPDGVHWTLRAAEQSLRSLARRPSDGLLVAAAFATTGMESVDDAASWTFDSTLKDPFLDIDWYESMNAFIAVVQVAANQDIYSSADGLSWNKLHYAPLYGQLAASGTRLVLAGWDLVGEGIATSTDGINWVDVYDSPPDKSLSNVIWTGTQFIALGENGAIVTSADGLAWTPRSSGVTTVLHDAAASPLRLVVVGNSGTIISSDDNGATWTAQTSGTSYGLNSIVWTGTEFVAAGNSGRLVRSADGLEWNVEPTPYDTVLFGADPFDFNRITWLPASERLVVFGTRGLIATSP